MNIARSGVCSRTIRWSRRNMPSSVPSSPKRSAWAAVPGATQPGARPRSKQASHRRSPRRAPLAGALFLRAGGGEPACGPAHRLWLASPQPAGQAGMSWEKLMPAYFVVELDITNADAMADYRAAVPGTLAQYGGRFL